MFVGWFVSFLSFDCSSGLCLLYMCTRTCLNVLFRWNKHKVSLKLLFSFIVLAEACASNYCRSVFLPLFVTRTHSYIWSDLCYGVKPLGNQRPPKRLLHQHASFFCLVAQRECEGISHREVWCGFRTPVREGMSLFHSAQICRYTTSKIRSAVSIGPPPIPDA